MLLAFLTLPLRGDASELKASLITAWPGSEIYELCGHEAIRIQGDGIDSVWNFGLFNFNEPNFVYRFVKGETDYNVAGYPFGWFMPEYVNRGSRVEEQILNLNEEEVNHLRRLLQKVSLPPNNRYRYNYIKNNCSTQIAALLDSVAGAPIEYQDTVRFATYREAMRHYHANYPWYQMGIDLALGNGLEEQLTQREELFVPVEFHRHANKAMLPGGRPLVKETKVLYPGREDAVLPPTRAPFTPLWFSILIAAISAGCIFWGIRKGTPIKWWYAVYFACSGLAGILIFFLVFISSHAATSPNLLIFWLNPLQLLIPIFIWARSTQSVVKVMMWLNILAVGLLLILMPIIDRGQAGQTSLIILAATDFVLAAAYLYQAMRAGKQPSTVGKSRARKSSNRTKSTRKGSRKR